VINRILLAVDLSVYTHHILQHAATMSNQFSASIVVVHAVKPLGTLGHALLQTYLKPDIRESLTTTGTDSIVDQIRTQIIDILTDEYMAGEMELPRLEGVIVRPGVPEEVIMAVADEINTDIIMLGSCKPEEKGAYIGGVAQRILASSKYPVYLIPYPQPVWQQPNELEPEARL
jgi:nucleotide-binding universal stress UspA family protein